MSTKNYYQLYLEQCFNLVGSMTIKSSSTASLINEYLNLQIGNNSQLVSDYYNPDDKTTWKYYLNLSGQYFLPFDTIMYVKSLDTLQDIEFTPSNLSLNPLTFQAYQYGSSYYNKLVTSYPNQIPLINSILYPVDINTAINAKDGTILSYNKSLVESNEYNLIPELQDYIYKLKERYNIRGFELTDSLYIVANLGIMYLNILPKILNIRLKYAKTPQANSFHVNQYLASHNNVYSLSNQFNLSEKLWLYRNINYVQRNVGSQSTFKLLLDRFIAPNLIDLVTYKLVSYGFDSNNDVEIRLKQESLTGTNNSGSVYYPIDQVLGYENTNTNNTNFITNYSTDIINQLKSTKYNNLPTKIIKTNVDKNIPLVEHTKEDTFINSWCYLSANGYYTANVTFVNPIDQIEYTISALDAFIYLVYIEASSLGIALEFIPPYYVQRAPVLKYISISKLASVLSNENILPDQTELVNVANSQIQLEPMTTVNDFISYCNNLYTLIESQDIKINSIGDMSRQTQYKIMIDQFYIDEVIDFPSTYSSVASWLLEKGLPIFSYTIDEAQLLMNNIVNAATGHNYNLNKGINFNPNLVKLVQTLSSYNLQFLITKNANVVYIIENGIGIDSISLSATYSNDGVQYASVTYPATYSEYGASGMIGYNFYTALSTAQKNQLKDIYNL